MSFTPHLSAAALALLLATGVQAAETDGKALFMEKAVPACAVCHALKDAGATGEIGPSLDELKPDAARVAKALRNGIGQMPAYKDSLNAAQIEALSKYVAKASGGKP